MKCAIQPIQARILLSLQRSIVTGTNEAASILVFILFIVALTNFGSLVDVMVDLDSGVYLGSSTW